MFVLRNLSFLPAARPCRPPAPFLRIASLGPADRNNNHNNDDSSNNDNNSSNNNNNTK